MEGYKPRIADQLLADLLDACGCVLLEGSKKTVFINRP